jgi:hypothetical protein
MDKDNESYTKCIDKMGAALIEAFPDRNEDDLFYIASTCYDQAFCNAEKKESE